MCDRGTFSTSDIDLFLRTMLVNPSVVEGVYNNNATTELGEIFGVKGTREIKSIFPTSKPLEFIKKLIGAAMRKDSVVLDSFAGSGTTAHAVLSLNKQDGGNRRFILIECEDKYVNTVTAERVRRVIRGVPDAKNESLREGIEGSFTYCTMDEPIDIDNMLTGKSLPDYSTLASHLLYQSYLISTEKTLKQKQNGLFYSDDTRDYYLLYKPDIKYLQNRESSLTAKKSKDISKRNRPATVFATYKELPQRELSKLNIEFCRIPDAVLKRGNDTDS